MVRLSPAINPPVLKGIKVHTDNPFRFDFVLDQGNEKSADLSTEANKLIKYFLAALTTPEKDMWVNLSPYEKDLIVPEIFGQTEMGRDLLAQDYILKQITASLIYPEDAIGKKFWKRIYEEAGKKYGNTSVPVNTFNKVWIVPGEAQVYENAKTATAYVVGSSLKVMLESDYLSAQKHEIQTNDLGKQIVREIVIPQLTKEVNEGANFAQLRQVYNSLILATWYKKKVKDSILSKVYTDQNKVAGVNIDNAQEKQHIYAKYLEAFKKGAYNYIKEEQDPITQQRIPRKYFSGGFNMAMASSIKIDQAMSSDVLRFIQRAVTLLVVSVSLTVGGSTQVHAQQSESEQSEASLIEKVFLSGKQVSLPMKYETKEEDGGVWRAFSYKFEKPVGESGDKLLVSFVWRGENGVEGHIKFRALNSRRGINEKVGVVTRQVVNGENVDIEVPVRSTFQVFSIHTGYVWQEWVAKGMVENVRVTFVPKNMKDNAIVAKDQDRTMNVRLELETMARFAVPKMREAISIIKEKLDIPELFEERINDLNSLIRMITRGNVVSGSEASYYLKSFTSIRKYWINEEVKAMLGDSEIFLEQQEIDEIIRLILYVYPKYSAEQIMALIKEQMLGEFVQEKYDAIEREVQVMAGEAKIKRGKIILKTLKTLLRPYLTDHNGRDRWDELFNMFIDVRVFRNKFTHVDGDDVPLMMEQIWGMLDSPTVFDDINKAAGDLNITDEMRLAWWEFKTMTWQRIHRDELPSDGKGKIEYSLEQIMPPSKGWALNSADFSFYYVLNGNVQHLKDFSRPEDVQRLKSALAFVWGGIMAKVDRRLLSDIFVVDINFLNKRFYFRVFDDRRIVILNVANMDINLEQQVNNLLGFLLKFEPPLLTGFAYFAGSRSPGKIKSLDNAQRAGESDVEQNTFTKGGINFNTAQMNLKLQNAGESIRFNVDPTMLKQLQSAPGFMPMIINIQPMNDIKSFLGLS